MSGKELEVYERLQKIMNRWSIRTPKSKNLLKILQLIFTPEEAEILGFFKQPHLDALSPRKLVQRIQAKTDKYSEEKILEIVENLAKRGMIYSRRKTTATGKELVKYSIWPMVIGVFEWFFSKVGMNDGTYSDETVKKVVKLMEKYAYEGFLMEMCASNYPWARILPADRANKIVEVNEELGVDETVVLPFEQVKTAIERADGIAVIPCACRTESRYNDKPGRGPCDNPVDVCMLLGDIEHFKRAGMIVKELTKEEALEVLLDCEKKGLVHCTYNSQEMGFICNCCPCHCGILRGMVEMQNPKAFMRSNYMAKFNENECRNCYRCVEICPTKAIWHYMPHEEYEEEWRVDEDRCIGCGVCASNCPANKIDLVKVRNEIPEESVAECYMRVERERFH
ncbi:MAG: 4Fe-4S binding protein [Candidatus Helarchaeota archaeon]